MERQAEVGGVERQYGQGRERRRRKRRGVQSAKVWAHSSVYKRTRRKEMEAWNVDLPSTDHPTHHKV